MHKNNRIHSTTSYQSPTSFAYYRGLMKSDPEEELRFLYTLDIFEPKSMFKVEYMRELKVLAGT